MECGERQQRLGLDAHRLEDQEVEADRDLDCSRSNTDLPMPASPTITTAEPSVSSADRRDASSLSSVSRPTNS